MTKLNMAAARSNMVEQQIRTWDIVNPDVVELLRRLPRDRFVPKQYQGIAYADTNIPLPEGQQMLSPKLQAKILQTLALTKTDRVLEVGTGSGYLTACLAHLAAHVTSVEIQSSLADQASINLDQEKLSNVSLRTGDALTELGQLNGTFNAVVVSASAPDKELSHIFKPLVAPGGRLFMIIGKKPVMTATLFTRVNQSDWTEQKLFETEVAALIHSSEPVAFNF